MIIRPHWRPAAVVIMSLHAYAGAPAPDSAIPAAVIAALADPRRPLDQVQLDATRHPDLTLAFAGVKAGDRVADFMPGNAYFTRILSDVVGPTGRVYAFIPAEQIANCPAREIAGSRAIAADRSYANVTLLSASLAAFSIPEKLDLIWTAQNYHDLHDTFMGPADVASLNKAFFNALKPGGVFLVIDHVAEPQSGLRDTETLHRIDPVRMRAEIEAAGFVFESQSDVLRNPADDHQRTVFDPVIRGRTDQVVFKFRKPL
jgi:predicted methyltransferase